MNIYGKTIDDVLIQFGRIFGENVSEFSYEYNRFPTPDEKTNRPVVQGGSIDIYDPNALKTLFDQFMGNHHLLDYSGEDCYLDSIHYLGAPHPIIVTGGGRYPSYVNMNLYAPLKIIGNGITVSLEAFEPTPSWGWAHKHLTKIGINVFGPNLKYSHNLDYR